MDLNSIRCNIKRLRKSARITQKEMALKLFMDERTYSKFERGENKSMDIRLLASIASLLEIDFSALLQDAEEQQANSHKEQDHLNYGYPSSTSIDIEKEIRTLKEEVHELIMYHKEVLRLLKTYS
jgi:transcriptional regulator with XRE-family HTH domain